jgi:hypothetical protein
MMKFDLGFSVPSRTGVAVALSVALCVLAALPAAAGSRAVRGDQEIVVAESRFGHGTVSGPVRFARYGREVRLPGGTWEPCKRSCSESLRVATVDFWEAQNGIGIGAACGVLGCLELRYPR